ncbi:MAG TPA: glutaredoxin family protein [Candidatus Acidoferrales bacterium]|nr:glutaredoxin family protein [Candidatus Acidoferrales bacterium]
MAGKGIIPDLSPDGPDRLLLEAFDRLETARLRPTDLATAAQASPEATQAALARLAAGGCLRETAGQFERTELGRLEVAGPRDLTLLSRPGCHLCEEARRAIHPLLAESGARLRVVDVDSDRMLRELFGNEIPVLFLGRREIARHRISARQLREDLRREAWT